MTVVYIAMMHPMILSYQRLDKAVMFSINLNMICQMRRFSDCD